jgi:hypothetical protein
VDDLAGRGNPVDPRELDPFDMSDDGDPHGSRSVPPLLPGLAASRMK